MHIGITTSATFESKTYVAGATCGEVITHYDGF